MPQRRLKRASFRRVLKAVRRIDTQAMREEIVDKLKELIAIAHDHAVNRELPSKVRRDWSRLEAYLAQTLNSIMRAYDMVQIKQQLEELKRIVDQELGE